MIIKKQQSKVRGQFAAQKWGLFVRNFHATADLASGMYMVNILAQGAQQTLPLLIAK
ncbi:MAG TPA: hypothetical protein PKC38_03975 [Chitinophagales bacterium]|nr:hypothetical protein [Chitinophagales bacterium]